MCHAKSWMEAVKRLGASDGRCTRAVEKLPHEVWRARFTRVGPHRPESERVSRLWNY